MVRLSYLTVYSVSSPVSFEGVLLPAMSTSMKWRVPPMLPALCSVSFVPSFSECSQYTFVVVA